MCQRDLILNDEIVRELWFRHFGRFTEENYKESEFYKHDFSIFVTERTFEEFQDATAWAVSQFVKHKEIEREFSQVSLPHSLPVDELILKLTKLKELMR